MGAEQSKSRRSQDAGKSLSATIGEGGTERKDGRCATGLACPVGQNVQRAVLVFVVAQSGHNESFSCHTAQNKLDEAEWLPEIKQCPARH